jgi:lactate dehydrogenase-like 2-hydroxyacid dehydrogenase
LRNRRIAGAGLDVYEHEPALTPGLSDLPNVVLAPHLASASLATRTRMGMVAVDNLMAVLNGGRAPFTVNPEVYDRA